MQLDDHSRDDANDGGDVKFYVGKPSRYGRPGAFRFYGPNNVEVLKIDHDGRFWVEGRLVDNDRLVYEGFRLWLSQSLGHMSYHMDPSNEA